MAELYDFQKGAVAQLMAGKHIIVAGCGCLAKGTPIKMADGIYKNVEDVKCGDMVLGYDEYDNIFTPSEVGSMFRTCHKPKPMIEFSYDSETVRTTYDHPFYNGEGFYPLYQLIWGALETSQRVQLELLCKQYGQTFDYKKTKCKHSCCDDTCERCQRLLQNGNERENCKSPQNSSGELAGKSEKIAMCKPYQRRQSGQSSGEFRVVFGKIQCLVGDKDGNNKTANTSSECEIYRQRPSVCEERVSKINREYGEDSRREFKKSKVLRGDVQEVPRDVKGHNKRMGSWSFKVLPAEPYYTISLRTAPHTYCIGRKHNFIVHNSGKNPMSMVWAANKCKEASKDKIVVVTTASKAKLTDHWDDLCAFCPLFSKSLSSFSLLSWHKLAAWVNANWRSLDEYVYVFDEIQRCAAGVSSGMGRAFLKITNRTKDWAGFTGTPGDTWLKFYPYLQACGLVRNKTMFLNTYASIQTYKGYPEIIGWRNEDRLKDMWTSISYAPDTSRVMAELPDQTHKVVEFKKPSVYGKVLKTRHTEDGEFLDTSAALCSELRRLCFTKDKQEWIKDFVDGLESGCVFFYNFVKTGDTLEEIIKKALPKEGKVWRIDGKHHDIPTAKTIGPRDMVLCQWQSGSEALNLQFLHYWVSVEACYSYSTSIQARGRIRRIGQKMPQFYYYLKTKHTIEDAVYEALKNKSDFAEDVWCADNNITKEVRNERVQV